VPAPEFGCSLSDIDRLSGGPSVPTLTRPDISPRAEENVKVNDPRPSASGCILSKLRTPVALRLRFVDAVPGTAIGYELAHAPGAPVRARRLIPIGAGVLIKDLLALTLLARIYGTHECNFQTSMKYHLNVRHKEQPYMAMRCGANRGRRSII
jgi:hypothetical protein